jgi:hypothetical protein
VVDENTKQREPLEQQRQTTAKAVEERAKQREMIAKQLTSRLDSFENQLKLMDLTNPGFVFQILMTIEGATKAIAVAREIGFIDGHGRKLVLQPPNDSNRAQLFKSELQGNGDANVIMSVQYGGYAWDTAEVSENGRVYCSPKHGNPNQRFFYRSRIRRLGCPQLEYPLRRHICDVQRLIGCAKPHLTTPTHAFPETLASLKCLLHKDRLIDVESDGDGDLIVTLKNQPLNPRKDDRIRESMGFPSISGESP